MRLSLALASLAVIAACSQSETAPSTPASSADTDAAIAEASPGIEAQQEANTKVVRDLYAAFEKGDVPAVLGAFSSDIVWNEAEGAPYADRNPYEGANEIATGLFARLGSEWDYFNAVPSDFLPSGEDKVVAIGRYDARNKATGKEMDIPFVHIWTLNDGKITAFQQYTDTATHAAVMSADPVAEPAPAMDAEPADTPSDAPEPFEE